MNLKAFEDRHPQIQALLAHLQPGELAPRLKAVAEGIAYAAEGITEMIDDHPQLANGLEKLGQARDAFLLAMADQMHLFTGAVVGAPTQPAPVSPAPVGPPPVAVAEAPAQAAVDVATPIPGTITSADAQAPADPSAALAQGAGGMFQQWAPSAAPATAEIPPPAPSEGDDMGAMVSAHAAPAALVPGRDHPIGWDPATGADNTTAGVQG